MGSQLIETVVVPMEGGSGVEVTLENLSLEVVDADLDKCSSDEEESDDLIEEEIVQEYQPTLAELENKQAHDLYLGVETGASIASSSISVSGLSDVSITTSDLTSVASEGVGRSLDDQISISTTGGGEGADYSVLDRYGFIVVAPRDNRYGGNSNGLLSSDERDLRRKQEQQGQREARRAIKWVEMLKTLEPVNDRKDWLKEHKKFEGRLLKGIPECMRTKLWGLFLSLPLQPSSQDSQQYKELYLKISGFERQIDLDIERTLREHILFKARFSSAQVSLFKILVAYSNLDPEVGYCQGMSNIAAFLLIFFEEEMAYMMLRQIMQRQDSRLFFTAGFPLLFETFYVQEQLMKKYVPAVLARLDSFHISMTVYATKWYLTLFLGFPFSLAARIWDLFIYWGMDILICVSLALIKLHEAPLLSLDYENCMQFLSKLPDTPIDENKLIKLTWTIWRRVNPHYDDPLRSGESNSLTVHRKNFAKIEENRRRSLRK